MKTDNYFVGLDMGTNSVGFAVTNADYQILKANRKSIWGVRIFDQASTGAKRRVARSARRRREREVLRLKLLQDIFAPSINQIDPAFFQRLNDSFFLPCDKTFEQKYSLFNDTTFTDVEYHRTYPTIYHLRHALMTENRPFDVRLVYLAIHHILKHRGHFLYSGMGSFNLGAAYGERFNHLRQTVVETLEIEIPQTAEKIFYDTLLDSNLKREEKVTQIMIQLRWDEKLQKDFVRLLLGYKVSLVNLFGDAYKDATPDKVSFSDATFEEEGLDKLSKIISEQELDFLIAGYQFFGHMRLELLLRGSTSFSAAKIALYEKHKKDLADLKRLVKNDGFDSFFNLTQNNTDNYVAYTGHLRLKGIKQPVNYRCNSEKFYSELKKQLEKLPSAKKENPVYIRIQQEIESSQFLPLQKTKDNSLVPNQMQAMELRKILDNAEQYLPFLASPGEEGLTIRQMIESLLSFRIPYYVGPLNAAHSVRTNKASGSHHAWLTKNSPEPVRPWNFRRVVDETQSAIDFIANLTNKCSQLIGEDVLPKASPTYSQYAILNLLNVIRVDGEKIDPATKQKLFNNYFMNPLRRERLTRKSLLKWLAANNYPNVQEENLSGVDLEIPGDMRADLAIEAIDPNLLTRAEKDQIVRILTVLPDSSSMIYDRFKSLFGEKMTEKQLQELAGLRFNGWGRLSDKLLNGITSAGPDGQQRTILNMMWDYNYNLQEILSSQFTFAEQIIELNREILGQQKTLSYRTVQEYPASPAVKKMIWQALKVVREIVKVMKKPPEKIFLEVAREEGKKERTVSRKKQLEALYKEAKIVDAALRNELEHQDDNRLRRKKIFLYFLQMGKCAYSGEPIDLERIDAKDSSGDDIYDLDHIYPRSLTKDDSLHNNLVLVKGIINRDKGDEFPVPPTIQNRQRGWWSMLKNIGLMSSEKFYRLTRTSRLSETELEGFINRQLVETRQATKAAAEILKLFLPDTRIVFVKAGHVTDFRYNQEKFKFIKVRGMNDLHHAKDAYLNIVVGNVFDTKFTANPRIFIRSNPPRSYNLAKMYDFPVKNRSGNLAWQPGEDGSLATVRKMLNRNNVLVTYQTRHQTSGQNGGLFDQMIMPKGQGQFPIKQSDRRLSSPKGMNCYGAYNKPTGYSFFVVDHLKKKKIQRTIVPLPLYLASTQTINPHALAIYCEKELGLVQPKIVLTDLPYNSIVRVKGFPLRLLAKTGNSLKMGSALQPVYQPEFEPLIKWVLRVEDEAEEFRREKYLSDEMLMLYDNLTEKISSPPFNQVGAYGTQLKNIIQGRECFLALSVYEQQKVLRQMLGLFLCDGRLSDFSMLLPKDSKGQFSSKNKQVGMITINQDLTDNLPIELIMQSPTGLFETTFNLAINANAESSPTIK